MSGFGTACNFAGCRTEKRKTASLEPKLHVKRGLRAGKAHLGTKSEYAFIGTTKMSLEHLLTHNSCP